jgi:hypothetical protein
MSLDYWVSGLCPTSDTGEETGSVCAFVWKGGPGYQIKIGTDCDDGTEVRLENVNRPEGPRA